MVGCALDEGKEWRRRRGEKRNSLRNTKLKRWKNQTKNSVTIPKTTYLCARCELVRRCEIQCWRWINGNSALKQTRILCAQCTVPLYVYCEIAFADRKWCRIDLYHFSSSLCHRYCCCSNREVHFSFSPPLSHYSVFSFDSFFRLFFHCIRRQSLDMHSNCQFSVTNKSSSLCKHVHAVVFAII